MIASAVSAGAGALLSPWLRDTLERRKEARRITTDAVNFLVESLKACRIEIYNRAALNAPDASTAEQRDAADRRMDASLIDLQAQALKTSMKSVLDAVKLYVPVARLYAAGDPDTSVVKEESQYGELENSCLNAFRANR